MIKDSTRHLMFRKGAVSNNRCKLAIKGQTVGYAVSARCIADRLTGTLAFCLLNATKSTPVGECPPIRQPGSQAGLWLFGNFTP